MLPADCVGTMWIQGAEPETCTEYLLFSFLDVLRSEGVLWFLVVKEGAQECLKLKAVRIYPVTFLTGSGVEQKSSWDQKVLASLEFPFSATMFK